MMDVFRFFVERDLMFEATLFAEKELATNIQEEGEVKDNSDISEGNGIQKSLIQWFKMS